MALKAPYTLNKVRHAPNGAVMAVAVPRTVSGSTAAGAYSRRSVRAADSNAEAVVQLNEFVNEELSILRPVTPGSVSDVEDYIWNRAQTKITIFSAQQYVANYLKPPFEAAGYVNLNFVDVSERP